MTENNDHSPFVVDGYERLLNAVWQEQNKNIGKEVESAPEDNKNGFLRKVWKLLNANITIIPFQKKDSLHDASRQEKTNALKKKYKIPPADALF